MAAGNKTSTSKIATILVLIPLILLGWWASSIFFPVWRWSHMDFEKLAAEKKYSEAELRREFHMIVRYYPRGEKDPFPWQIVKMNPIWSSDQEPDIDETDTLVRCDLISENDGSPPGLLTMGSGTTWSDRYFQLTGWRVPSGSFGRANSKRPLVIYKGFSLSKLPASGEEGLSAGYWRQVLELDEPAANKWTNDDFWPDRQDGFKPK